MIFAEFSVIRMFGFKRAYCWRRKGPKQDLWCIMCTGALLMYAAVAIVPAASSFSQTRSIFHGVRQYIANSSSLCKTLCRSVHKEYPDILHFQTRFFGNAV